MSCERFEREGLLLLEQGAALPEHFATCADCIAARRACEGLRAELATAMAGEEPPLGWQARVKAEIAARRRSRGAWRRWLWLAGPALAAAALLVLWVRTEREPGEKLALVVEVQEGTIVRRGKDAHPGDRLRLRGMTGGARFAELRVYRNDQGPFVSCSTEPPCRRVGETIELEFTFPAVGSYQPVILASENPIPAPSTGKLDPDAAEALTAGARVELGEGVRVR